MVYRLSFTDTSIWQLLLPSPVCNQWNVLLKLVNVQRKNTPELMNDGWWIGCELILCALHRYGSCVNPLGSIALELHAISVGNAADWSFHIIRGVKPFSGVKIHKIQRIHRVHITVYITCNIKSLLNVPKISHISRKISQVSRFPAKSPDSRNKFVFLPKQPLLELSPPVILSEEGVLWRRYTSLFVGVWCNLV